MFIVLEGIDGAGKSTQIDALIQWFQRRDRDVVTCSDPGTTALGTQLRQLLLGDHQIPIAPRSELMLFMAARAQLVSEVIAPALAADRVVICDRFLLSSVVYQGYLGSIPPEEIWELGRLVVGSTVPDVTFVLDLPAEVAATRRSNAPDRIEARGLDYLENVRQCFLREARQHPDSIHVVDATRAAEQVSEAMVRGLQSHLPDGS